MKSHTMSADPFVVHVARLRRQRGSRRHEIRRALFDPERKLRPRSAADSAVPEEAEAEADVVLESFEGGVMATGTVTAPWVGVCARCTVPVQGELQVRVRERFTDPSSGDPDDDLAYPIVEDDLDLRDMVRDAVVLELPLAPLCRPDCQGLCPQCGADRNTETCDCVEPRDPRWATLDVLRAPH